MPAKENEGTSNQPLRVREPASGPGEEPRNSGQGDPASAGNYNTAAAGPGGDLDDPDINTQGSER